MAKVKRIQCPKCGRGDINLTEELVTWGDLVFNGHKFDRIVFDGEAEMQPTGRYFAKCRVSGCGHRWRPRASTVELAFDLQHSAQIGGA